MILQKLHHDNEGKNCTEDLDQRGYTHCAASYTTSLMHNIQGYTNNGANNIMKGTMPYMYYTRALPGENA